jgi:hypothetical protein
MTFPRGEIIEFFGMYISLKSFVAVEPGRQALGYKDQIGLGWKLCDFP